MSQAEIRKCNHCGEEWKDGGDLKCPFCGCESTEIVEDDEMEQSND